jgi:predicted nucleic acid-binding protein
MILIDTSVLIRYLRTASPAIREVFASTDCGICGVTRAEILHGARTPEAAL